MTATPTSAARLCIVTGAMLLPGTPVRAAEPATELGKLAKGMKPGTWAELSTANLVEAHRAKGNSGAIFGYNEGAVWDPRSRQWLYVGGDHNDPARFVTYSADRNSWIVMPQPDWLS